MNSSRNKWYLVLVTVGFTLIILASCSKYQSESYTIQGVDAKGCEMLSDTIFQRINAANWKHENVADSVSEIIDRLQADTVFVEEEKNTYLIQTDAAEDSTYFAFISSMNSVIFFYNRSVEMELFQENGTIIKPSNTTMPPETAADCINETATVPTPLIKTRWEYGTPGNRYLVRIIKNEQTGSASIFLAIVKN
jgi:hypothetical protein